MKSRAPKAFDLVAGKIDRDRARARSAEQAKHIEAAAYHAAQARLCRVEKADLEHHAKGELRALRDMLTAHTDAAGAASLFGKIADQIPFAKAVKHAEAERVFAKAANDGAADD